MLNHAKAKRQFGLKPSTYRVYIYFYAWAYNCNRKETPSAATF